jgi:HK97 family phage major capsid protein
MGQPFRDEVATLARRRLTIRDLLPVVAVSSNSVEWPSMTSRPGAAATVAEGALKPQSDMTLELRNVNTQVIAHWVPASRQILDDAPQLRDLIDTELRHGLALVEEAQLLAGDGVAPNLHGLIPQATAFADPSAGAIVPTNLIDQIALAILQSALADFPATGVIVHPSDWTRMRMAKDADGKYLLGAPGADVPPVLFGLPVVASQAIAAGSYLVGDFQQAATLYDRWTPRVEISTEHADFFTRNLVAILAEQRIALAVRKPAALITGTFA